MRLSNTGKSIKTQNSHSLVFDIIGLKPGSSYTISVRAKTKFGTSEPVYVPVVTLIEPIKQLAETKVKEKSEEESEKTAIILGGIVTIVLLVVMILLSVFTHRRRLLERRVPTAQLEVTRGPHLVKESELSIDSVATSIPSSTFHSYKEIVPTISNDGIGKVRKLGIIQQIISYHFQNSTALSHDYTHVATMRRTAKEHKKKLQVVFLSIPQGICLQDFDKTMNNNRENVFLRKNS